MHDGDDIDEAAGLDRVVHEVRFAAEPEMHQWLAKFCRHRIGGNKCAPGGAVAKRRRLLSRKRPATLDQMPSAPISAMPRSSQHLRAALGEHADAFDVRGEILDVDAEMEFDVEFLLGHIGERELQVAAMHRPIGRTVAAFHLVTERNTHDLRGRSRLP